MIVFVFAVCVCERVKTEGLDRAYAPEQSRNIHWPMVCVKNCLMDQMWGEGTLVSVGCKCMCMGIHVRASVCKFKQK